MKYSYNKLFIAIVFIFFSFTVNAQETSDKSITENKASILKILRLKVTGINCGGDIKDIQTEITKVNGVTSCLPAKKPAATTHFEVTYNPDVVTEKEIRNAVENTAGCSDPESRPYKVKI